MKIGLLAYSTNTGLGYQTYDFYRHMKPDKVLLVDLSRLNGVQTHHERYSGQVLIANGIPANHEVEWLVNNMDIVFVCETPLNYHLYQYARSKKVRVVQQYNYEFLDYHRNPLLSTPTVLGSPSMWNIDKVKEMDLKTDVVLWQVPIDCDLYKPRQISEVKTLLHIVGRPAANDRNGTIPFCDMALKLEELGHKFDYEVYVQTPTEHRTNAHFDTVKTKLRQTEKAIGKRFKIIKNIEDNSLMYKTGDLFILPRRYGGLCLPMWEALASGIPVIMTDISPNYYTLPGRWLVEAKLQGSFNAHTEIFLYEAFTDSLVERVLDLKDSIQMENEIALAIADKNSWTKQKEFYKQRFEILCES